MPNNITTSQLVSKTTSELLAQKSPIFNVSNNDHEDMFTQKEYAVGSTVSIKRPGYFPVVQGLDLTAAGVADITDSVTPVTVTTNDYDNVLIDLTLFEDYFDVLPDGTKALTEKAQDRIIDNYGATIYTSLESRIEQKAYKELSKTAFYSTIQDPEDLKKIDAFSDVSAADALYRKLKIKTQGCGLMNITDGNTLANSLQNSFNKTLNQDISESARVGGDTGGRLVNFDIYQSPDFIDHEAGTLVSEGGALTVASISADGLNITVTRATTTNAATIKAGDMFAIPSVNLLERVGKFPLIGEKLVITAKNDVTIPAGTATGVITLSTPLKATGLHANVASLPATNAPMKMFGDHRKNFFMSKGGLTAIGLPIGDIKGAENSDNTLNNTKLPVKVTIQGNVTTGSNRFRLYLLTIIKAFGDYIIVVPSLIPGA